MRRPLTRYAVICAVLTAILALVVGLNDLGHFNTDIKPEVYLAPWQMVGQYLSSWTSTPYLGSANFNVGLVPVLLVLSALRAVGLDPEWTFKVFHFGLWFLAAWGAVRLTRAAAPRAGPFTGLAAGVFYLANPYTVVGGSTLAIALPMAFLPWLLLAYLRAVQHPRSWGWPAAFGLAFFAMSGMNVAVVPLFQLFGIVPIMIVARWHLHRRWRELLLVTARCAAFVVLLSLYWLVPAVSALSAGSQIVAQSETLDGIHKVSSFTEVLRGMGLWPLYGRSDTGPWVPQDAVYLTSVPVILLTGLWPVLSLVALRWARSGLRRVLALTIAVAAVVMVGLFPGQNRAESPFGWLLQGLLASPGLAAFRTTNKIGALLALAFALALAGGLVVAVRSLRGRGPLAPVAASLACILGVSWILPALAGGLYISRMDIPDYWTQAAKAADEGDPNSTVLMLPAQTRPTYRWTVQRPDDLTNSLLRRDAVIPETTPNASLPGANFLTALGDAVEEGTASGSLVSTYARYLGADNVLVRNDTVWETDGGARPRQVANLIAGDANLFGLGRFGTAGQNVISPTQSPQGASEALLPPVQLYGVKDSRAAVRAQSTQGQVIVAGDGFAFTSMAGAGLLRSTPTVRYAQDANVTALTDALRGGAHLVLTDTNARRDVIPQRLTANEGALLAPDEPLADTRTLGSSSDDQTVLVRSGTIVHATSAGATFFDMPYAIAENAFDGDPQTSWRFGDFRRAPGQKLTLTLPAQQTLGDVTISQPDLGPVHIAKATMTAGGRSVTATVPAGGTGVFHMGGVKATQVTVTVDSIGGAGFNLVGISELGLPGPKAVRSARTPLTLTKLYGGLSADQRVTFDRTPFDILLRRVLNTASTQDDSETALRRLVSMPDTRRYDVTASVRLGSGSLETLYDRSVGLDTSTAVTSSAFYFDQPTDRASQALDGSDTTGWTPGNGVRGSWWQWSGGTHDVSKVAVTQKPGTASASRTRWARNVSVLVDGAVVAHGTLTANGTTTVPLPHEYHAHSVRLRVDSTSGPATGDPARFTTIDAGFRPGHTDPGALDSPGRNRCLPVATVDGQPIAMRLAATQIAGREDGGTQWTSCAPVTLTAGDRRIEQTGPFVLDSLNLTDTSGHRTAPTVRAPSQQVTKHTSNAATLTLGPSATPLAVVVGQSFDPRWHAQVDGRDLGPATTIDGFSTGWLLPAGGSRTVTMSFAPQHAANLAIVISALGFLVALGLALTLLSDRARWTAPAHRTQTWPREQRLRAAAARPDHRLAREVAFVLLAGFGAGAAGCVGALAVVAAIRSGRVASRVIVWAGAVLVFVGLALYCLLDPNSGEVSADAISASLWPHRIAAAGLVIGLGGLLRRPSTTSTPRKDQP